MRDFIINGLAGWCALFLSFQFARFLAWLAGYLITLTLEEIEHQERKL